MSLTNALYRAARASATGRAAARGPGALGRREVRRTVYRHTGRATRSILRAFKL
jgi:hypothetical protein